MLQFLRETDLLSSEEKDEFFSVIGDDVLDLWKYVQKLDSSWDELKNLIFYDLFGVEWIN